jgi:hypothetical protein
MRCQGCDERGAVYHSFLLGVARMCAACIKKKFPHTLESLGAAEGSTVPAEWTWTPVDTRISA